jgi:DNA-directed RNA polymerase specialized sigma24 family protein
MTRLHCRKQPGDAFGQFYDRHVASVLAYFRRRTGDAELAMDLTAETFARALETRPARELASGESTGWLFTIAHNLLVDSYRRGQVDDRARTWAAWERVRGHDHRPAATAASAPMIHARAAGRGRNSQRRRWTSAQVPVASSAPVEPSSRTSVAAVRGPTTAGLTRRSTFAGPSGPAPAA